MTAILSFVGLAEVRKMIAVDSPREIQNALRRGAYAGAKAFKDPLVTEARIHHGSGSGNVPLSFQKVKAPKVTTHGGTSGHDIEAYIRPASPLFNILDPGAKAHTITPGEKGFNSYRPSRPYPTKAHKTGKRALAGPAGSGRWDPVGRKRSGDFFATHPVQHPGLAGRDLLAPAFQQGLPAAEDAIANAIFGHSVGSVVG